MGPRTSNMAGWEIHVFHGNIKTKSSSNQGFSTARFELVKASFIVYFQPAALALEGSAFGGCGGWSLMSFGWSLGCRRFFQGDGRPIGAAMAISLSADYVIQLGGTWRDCVKLSISISAEGGNICSFATFICAHQKT